MAHRSTMNVQGSPIRIMRRPPVHSGEHLVHPLHQMETERGKFRQEPTLISAIRGACTSLRPLPPHIFSSFRSGFVLSAHVLLFPLVPTSGDACSRVNGYVHVSSAVYIFIVIYLTPLVLLTGFCILSILD